MCSRSTVFFVFVSRCSSLGGGFPESEAAVSRLEEAKHVDELEESAEYQLHVGALVECITRLNVAANMQRTPGECGLNMRMMLRHFRLRKCGLSVAEPLLARMGNRRESGEVVIGMTQIWYHGKGHVPQP